MSKSYGVAVDYSPFQPFFVDRYLNGDMRKLNVTVTLKFRCNSGMIARVALHVTYWARQLKKAACNDDHKEKRECGEDGNCCNEPKTCIITVITNFS